MTVYWPRLWKCSSLEKRDQETGVVFSWKLYFVPTTPRGRTADETEVWTVWLFVQPWLTKIKPTATYFNIGMAHYIPFYFGKEPIHCIDEYDMCSWHFNQTQVYLSSICVSLADYDIHSLKAIWQCKLRLMQVAPSGGPNLGKWGFIC